MTRDEKIIDRLTEFVRTHAPGGCKRVSLGDRCPCLLCDIDRLAAGAPPALVALEEAVSAVLDHDELHDTLHGTGLAERLRAALAPPAPAPVAPPAETCSTCGATTPDGNLWCSNGFHATAVHNAPPVPPVVEAILVRQYMQHVINEESVSFVRTLRFTGMNDGVPTWKRLGMTEDDVRLLETIDKELARR